jgi:hypothetical protein
MLALWILAGWIALLGGSVVLGATNRLHDNFEN